MRGKVLVAATGPPFLTGATEEPHRELLKMIVDSLGNRMESYSDTIKILTRPIHFQFQMTHHEVIRWRF